ncbi:MAG: hypothetical protein MJA83_13790 [Gammaproteobacteria bacterium]|nr:hypothetical protein [Gammaproteobacteria bacterium]
MSDNAKKRKELLERRVELVERLEKIKTDLNHSMEADIEEQTAQHENRDTLLEMERVTSEELQKVEEDLSVLDEDIDVQSSQ